MIIPQVNAQEIFNILTGIQRLAHANVTKLLKVAQQLTQISTRNNANAYAMLLLEVLTQINIQISTQRIVHGHAINLKQQVALQDILLSIQSNAVALAI